MPYSIPNSPVLFEFYTLGYAPPETGDMLIEFSDYSSYTRFFKSKSGGIIQNGEAYKYFTSNQKGIGGVVESSDAGISVNINYVAKGMFLDSYEAIFDKKYLAIGYGYIFNGGESHENRILDSPKCYWFNGITEFSLVNGSDVLGDGTGLSFKKNDVVFIYNESTYDDLVIYSLFGFSATETSNSPYCIIGPYVQGVGYSIWYTVNVAYSTSAIDLELISAKTCTQSTRYPICCELVSELYNNFFPILYSCNFNFVSPNYEVTMSSNYNGIEDDRIYNNTFTFASNDLILVYFDTLS